MHNNVFYENVDYLYQVRTDLEAVEQLKKEMAEYRLQEKSLKKGIISEEKSIQDEIAQTIKRRKNEIEREYDVQIDANKARSKSVNAKRDKTKTKRIGERFSNETAEIQEENRQYQVEMRTLFKAKHIPTFARSGFFYSLYMPKRISEYLVMILTILIVFAGVPSLIWLLGKTVFFKNNPGMLAYGSVLITAFILFIITLVYVLIFNSIKVKNYDTIKEGRHIRDEIEANKRQMRAIKNKIDKDKDDSQYGLDKYDDKLLELDEELNEISREKQDAMTAFENETKPVLIDEVNDRRLPIIEDMKARLHKLEDDIALLNEDIKNSSLAVANNYGAILGKEFCTSEKVDDLIALMEDGTADTVSEAIAAYKGAGR